jgi:hypothetical protein
MPNTNQIQLILAGAFMPDYYSTLATHFFNIWIEFEPIVEYDMPSNLGLKLEDIHQSRVIFIIIIII